MATTHAAGATVVKSGANVHIVSLSTILTDELEPLLVPLIRADLAQVPHRPAGLAGGEPIGVRAMDSGFGEAKGRDDASTSGISDGLMSALLATLMGLLATVRWTGLRSSGRSRLRLSCLMLGRFLIAGHGRKLTSDHVSHRRFWSLVSLVGHISSAVGTARITATTVATSHVFSTGVTLTTHFNFALVGGN